MGYVCERLGGAATPLWWSTVPICQTARGRRSPRGAFVKRFLLSCFCLAAVGLSACAVGGPKTATATSGAASVSAHPTDAPDSAPHLAGSHPTTTDGARRDAVLAYVAMWDDVASAALTADYHDHVLPHHATGAALSVLVAGLYSYWQQGLVAMGTPVPHPQIVSTAPSNDPTVVHVWDCFDDTRWLVYKASGGLADGLPGGHRRIRAVVTRLHGSWKVVELSTGEEGSC